MLVELRFRSQPEAFEAATEEALEGRMIRQALGYERPAWSLDRHRVAYAKQQKEQIRLFANPLSTEWTWPQLPHSDAYPPRRFNEDGKLETWKSALCYFPFICYDIVGCEPTDEEEKPMKVIRNCYGVDMLIEKEGAQ